MNELSFSFHSTVLQLHIPIQVTLTLSQRFNVNQRRMPTFCLFDAEWSWWTCDEAECWHSNIGQTWLYNWSCCCCCCEAPLGPSSKNICFWLSIIYSKAITKGKQIVVRFGEWHDGLRGRKCTKNRFDDVRTELGQFVSRKSRPSGNLAFWSEWTQRFSPLEGSRDWRRGVSRNKSRSSDSPLSLSPPLRARRNEKSLPGRETGMYYVVSLTSSIHPSIFLTRSLHMRTTDCFSHSACSSYEMRNELCTNKLWLNFWLCWKKFRYFRQINLLGLIWRWERCWLSWLMPNSFLSQAFYAATRGAKV